MKTKLDLLKPKEAKSEQRKIKAEQQFNDYHGAKWREFTVGDSIYYKLHHTNDKWQWVPGSVIEEIGSVNYRIRVSTPTGERTIKAHTNQLKRRYDKNELIELYELPDPLKGEIEPIIEPQFQQDKDDNVRQRNDTPNDSDASEDALDDTQTEDIQEEDTQEEVPTRRSTRSNFGMLPSRFGWD